MSCWTPLGERWPFECSGITGLLGCRIIVNGSETVLDALVCEGCEPAPDRIVDGLDLVGVVDGLPQACAVWEPASEIARHFFHATRRAAHRGRFFRDQVVVAQQMSFASSLFPFRGSPVMNSATC